MIWASRGSGAGEWERVRERGGRGIRIMDELVTWCMKINRKTLQSPDRTYKKWWCNEFNLKLNNDGWSTVRLTRSPAPQKRRPALTHGSVGERAYCPFVRHNFAIVMCGRESGRCEGECINLFVSVNAGVRWQALSWCDLITVLTDFNFKFTTWITQTSSKKCRGIISMILQWIESARQCLYLQTMGFRE